MSGYAELQVTSNYSFLRGASHPHELVERAAALGHRAIAIADRNTLAGVVRAHAAARACADSGSPIRLVVGSRLITQEGFSLLAFPLHRAGYGRLSRLLTLGNRRAEKGQCHLFLRDVWAHAEGLLAVAIPPDDPADRDFARRLLDTADVFRGRCHLAAHHLYRGDDARRLAQLEALAQRANAPLVATNDVHYHAAERRILQDVLSCVREKCTIDEAGWRLFANAERHLKPPQEMARLFRDRPEAVARTLEIAERCAFSLDELKYEYPIEDSFDGRTPQQELERLTWLGAAERYPEGVSDKVAGLLRHELKLIEQLNYAPYFLTVHDIVTFARSRGILCQGRGSAANSAVCYCIGITAIDPVRIDLLFERFISAARNEPPDIDVDFEHERREEVIQYIYGKYGRERAGLAATVIAYRSRSAIRDVGKALGLSPDTVGVLADTVWGSSDRAIPDAHVREAGLDPADRRLALALNLAAIATGFPRHLSQHVGGFVITHGRLDELAPIANAAMEDRTVLEWDKDDLDTLGILKIDVLALGMLSCIRRAFALIERHHGRALTLADVPAEDPAVYEMLQRADSLGVFQVESRAQMSMLPRLKPACFYDLVIQVAIVRPGPIQGDMVHPYLRRRHGEEVVSYPSEALREVLGKTMGVPLFQEQAMKIAIVAAGFTPTEADQLRRAMATFRRNGQIDRFRDKLVDGMVARGYERDFAERCYRQIEGFGDYGFPESHAASFALLAYVSSWLKCHYPDAFAAALLNSQPMGFYAPAQIVRDARQHGVEIRPPEINASDWDCTLETAAAGGRPPASGGDGRITSLCALRLGFRQIEGCSQTDVERLVGARGTGYRSMPQLWQRSGIGRTALEKLARADAFTSLGLGRREALWAVRGLRDERLPLFDGTTPAAASGAAPVREAPPLFAEPVVSLPSMNLGEHVVDDYGTLRLSLRAHPLALLREQLAEDRIVTSNRLVRIDDGKRLAVAGLVLVRQRPGSANGVVFVTLEDEHGIANVVVWPDIFERYRKVVMGARLMLVEGRLQRKGLVIHVVAERLTDLSPMLDTLGQDSLSERVRDIIVPEPARADEVKHPTNEHPRARTNIHPRDVRIVIKSHDFH